MLGRGGKSTCADGSYCAESSNCDGLLSIRDARREGVEERPHHGIYIYIHLSIYTHTSRCLGGESTCADGSYCAESSNCDGLLIIRDARREGVEERPHYGIYIYIYIHKYTCADGSNSAECGYCNRLLIIRDARREGVEERPHHGREARRVLERGGHHVQRRLALLPLLVFEIGEHLARK